MRLSKGTSLPLIASVDIAPATSAAARTFSGPKGGREGQRGGYLSPVQEREPLLGREPHRFQPDLAKRFPAAHGLLPNPGFALPDQHPREMGERRQVP